MSLRDSAWISRLPKAGRCGRAVQDHLASVELRVQTRGHEGAVQEVTTNRHTLCMAMLSRAQKSRPNPCGLPTPLPKYVVWANLSGNKMLLYTDSDTLMRKLCSRSSVMHPDDIAATMQSFHAHTAESGERLASNQEACVMIFYSMPWQAGIRSQYWEINTLTLSRGTGGSEARLTDRMLTLTSMARRPFMAKPTLAPDAFQKMEIADRVLGFLSSKQIETFSDEYRAQCLDDSPDTDVTEADKGRGSAEAGPSAGATTSAVPSHMQREADEKLREIMKAMKVERKKLLEELHTTRGHVADIEVEKAAEVGALKVMHDATLAAQQAKHEESTRLLEAICTEKEAELKGLRKTTSTQLTRIKQLEGASAKEKAARDKARKDTDAQNTLANANIRQQKERIDDLERQLAEREREHERALGESNRTSRQAAERATTEHVKRVAALEQKLEAKERLLNQLGENLERKDAELVALRAELADAAKEHAEQKTTEDTLVAQLRETSEALDDSVAEGARRAAETRAAARSLREADAELARVLSRPTAAVTAAVAATETHADGRVWARSVACETDTVGVQTHSDAITQTSDGRLLPEHLPEDVRVLAMVGHVLVLAPGTLDSGTSGAEDDSLRPTTDTAPTQPQPDGTVPPCVEDDDEVAIATAPALKTPDANRACDPAVPASPTTTAGTGTDERPPSCAPSTPPPPPELLASVRLLTDWVQHWTQHQQQHPQQHHPQQHHHQHQQHPGPGALAPMLMNPSAPQFVPLDSYGGYGTHATTAYGTMPVYTPMGPGGSPPRYGPGPSRARGGGRGQRPGR